MIHFIYTPKQQDKAALGDKLSAETHTHTHTHTIVEFDNTSRIAPPFTASNGNDLSDVIYWPRHV